MSDDKPPDLALFDDIELKAAQNDARPMGSTQPVASTDAPLAPVDYPHLIPPPDPERSVALAKLNPENLAAARIDRVSVAAVQA
jgi:hypothetical protein